jgi:hypothetical protein
MNRFGKTVQDKMRNEKSHKPFKRLIHKGCLNALRIFWDRMRRWECAYIEDEPSALFANPDIDGKGR